MKTSNKILGILSILLLVGIVLKINSNVKNEYPIDQVANKKFNEVTVGEFNRLESSGKVIVELSSGDIQKVRVFIDGNYNDNDYEIKTIDSTLFVSVPETPNDNEVFVKIETPNISSITAHNTNRIRIDDLNSDSLTIAASGSNIAAEKMNCATLKLIINDSSVYAGNNCTITNLSIVAKDHSKIKMNNYSVVNVVGEFHNHSTFTIGGYIKNSKIIADSTSSWRKYYH